MVIEISNSTPNYSCPFCIAVWDNLISAKILSWNALLVQEAIDTRQENIDKIWATKSLPQPAFNLRSDFQQKWQW